MESTGFQREKFIELYHREMDEWLQQPDAKDTGLKDGTPQWILILQAGNEWEPMGPPTYWEAHKLNSNDTIQSQKEVEVSVDWSDKEISFHLVTVDGDDAICFSGKEIGRTSEYDTAHTYKIPAALAEIDEGVIIIRVINYGGEGGIYGKPQQTYMEANGKKISSAGS